ncbi:MAG TPA: LysR family transcriptional regulator [Gammaproteobacteria bacterium]|nr:LysR family transcriptional regulator [Gammaproteobacteria bacterium]MCP5428981.1 LysR family transcriptional regulator [Chromatiaceae bacterium]MCP5436108.1 LysR family transcriptional regulator [Chromatiaceae bacterium]MCW5587064.1 LysR family transcriptional regulator [Chromatiales bacterium]HPQ24006.1 LysR family transcriptional regulator [Gammaproteobacteria bacterium]
MDLTLLRSFLAVAESGAITGAAERIGVTQSALSRRIQQLEQHLGVALLVRGRKGAALTEIGRLVQSEAQGIIARYEQMREMVSSQQRLEGGTVRIGGGATAVSFILPEAIAAFQGAHPHVRFQMREAGSSEIADDVVAGHLELGVVTLPVRDRELDVTPLATDRIVLVARHDHALAQRRRVRIQDLADQAFVAFEAGSALRHIIDGKLRDAGVEVNVVMELRSIPAILRMVSTTGNLAFVSQLGMEQQNDVVAVPVQGLRIERRLAVIARRGAVLSPAAAAFTTRLLSLQH